MKLQGNGCEGGGERKAAEALEEVRRELARIRWGASMCDRNRFGCLEVQGDSAPCPIGFGKL